ncbi:hypothetical protein D3C71_1599550 [compost metagenome]
MTVGRPGVKITTDSHFLGVGRPYGKAHTRNPVLLSRMRPQHTVAVVQISLVKQMQIMSSRNAVWQAWDQLLSTCYPF